MMFESIKDAEKFGKTKRDYLVFKLIKHKQMKSFEWEILPYGNYKEYLGLVKNYQKYGTKFHDIIQGIFN